MGKNKSLEAKRIKYLKQRKARPRYLKPNDGYMKTQSSVDKSRVPKELVSIVAYRERVRIKEEHDKEAFVDAILNALFPNNNPYVIPEREEEHLRLKVNTREPVHRHLVLQNGRYTKLAMVSNRDMTCVQFFEYQTIPGICRKSIEYGSYDRAMQVFQLSTIRWKEVLHIPNVEQPPLDLTS